MAHLHAKPYSLRLCAAVLRVDSLTLALTYSGRWLGWNWVALGGSLSFFAGGQHSASFDQGSAVDGTSPLFALGPQSRLEVLGFGSFPRQALLAAPAQLSYVVLRRKPSSGSSGVEVGSRTMTGGSLA